MLSSEEGKLAASLAEADFISVSAKTGDNIQKMMNLIIEKLFFKNLKISSSEEEEQK